jgi:hypothetical protein
MKKRKLIVDILKRRRRKQMIECIIGLIGISIGIGFGVWMMVQIFLMGVHH